MILISHNFVLVYPHPNYCIIIRKNKKTIALLAKLEIMKNNSNRSLFVYSNLFIMLGLEKDCYWTMDLCDARQSMDHCFCERAWYKVPCTWYVVTIFDCFPLFTSQSHISRTGLKSQLNIHLERLRTYMKYEYYMTSIDQNCIV